MKQYKLLAKGTGDCRNLTFDKEYITLRGIEEGIFPNRPYVTVIDDYGHEYWFHLSRFEIITEIDDNTTKE